MLYALLAGVFLYHLSRRLFLRQRRKERSASRDELPPVAFLDPTSEQLEQALKRAFGDGPRARFVRDRLRAPMALRDLVLGAGFLLIGLVLVVASLALAAENYHPAGSAETDWGLTLILGALGLAGIWTGGQYLRDGWRFMRKDFQPPPVTGITPPVSKNAGAPAQQQPPKQRRSREKQFEKL